MTAAADRMEPDALCPEFAAPPADEPPLELNLPEQPVSFILPTRIAFSGRKPYSLAAGLLQPGDPVRLVREPQNRYDPHAIRVTSLAGETAGYLYAEQAAWLSLLLDLAPPERDFSVITCTDRRPVAMEIRLQLAEAWPLFTIVAIFGLRSERFAAEFNLAGNPFLQPLAELNKRYRANYDYFQMPPVIVAAYARLRQRCGPASAGR